MKKNLVKTSLCFLLAVAFCFGDLASLLRRADIPTAAAATSEEATPTAHAAQSEPEQSEGVVRPEDIDEGLSLYSLDEIRGRRVTVRQPVMEVLQDDITRPHPQEMDNEYTMLDFSTGDVMHELAKIDFSQGGEREVGNKDRPMYPMKGLARSDKDEDGKVSKQKYFSEFTKYMLLRQAYYFNTHYSEIIKDNQLKKHPAADYIYGKIPDTAKAAKMHIVTDPIYRSPMTTGLYLAPGEVATVKIRGLEKGEALTLYTHHQDTMGYLGYNEDGKGFGSMEAYLKYWDDKIVEEATLAQSKDREPNFDQFNYGLHGQWQWQNQKVPCMGTTFSFVGTGKDMEVQIGSMYGGPLYIKPTTDAVDLVIEGALLTPHFVLGVTTVEEFEKELREAPGLVATMDVENGQLIGPAESMRNADDIEKLAYFWHSVFAIDISLNGRDYNYNMTMCYDMHVPAGEAVALNSNFCAQPEYWFPICMNYETLTTKGNWGTFHELGHVQAKTHGVNWGFCDGDGEVWNNTLILLIYSMLCNMDSRVISVEHGDYVHPYTAIQRSLTVNREQYYTDKATGEKKLINDYGLLNEGSNAHFDQLSMYATLLHSFGSEKFVDMFYTYKMNPAYCPNKRADFVYRIGVVDRVNILKWVNKNYFANIKDTDFTDSQLEFLQNLPDFVPVAYEWANGIDGHETARKHDVDGKHPTVFDVSRASFSSPGTVEVVSVTKAQHGTADYDPDTQTVKYTPPKDVTEYDRFDIIVKTDGGRRVTMNVNLRLLYNGVYTEVYDLGLPETRLPGTNRPSVAQAKTYIQGKTATSTETSSVACKADFTHSNMEYFHSTFRFRATKSGEHTFYLRADDASEVRFYRNQTQEIGTPTETLTTPSDKQGFEEVRKWTVTLDEGDTIFIAADLVNWGGKGHLHIGLRSPGEENVALKDIKDIPIENIIGADVTDDDLKKADAFKGWQPRFVDSIKNATIDYQHSNYGWQVLEAPVSEGGDSDEVQEQYRNYLVDGDENTAYHTKYNHGTGGTVVSTPHTFVIDTRVDQTFNYFDIIRRTNGNDKLLEYELYGCAGNEYSVTDGVDNTTWHQLFKGATSNEGAAKQRISFARTQVRYFKLVITKNSGHTVIKEVYAGIESKLSQTVKPSNYMTNKEDLADSKENGFVENSANGKLSTTRAGATFEFEFLGNGFELFADTHPDYGKASVTVDEIPQEEIDLSDDPIFNKMVFASGELEMGVHRVVVTTLDENPFNISFINVQYGTPVAADDYPATDTYGDDVSVPRQFSREWKTYVKDYKELTSIQFLQAEPAGYKDTYVRFDTYIRLYRYKNEDTKENKIAFVYPGTILAPIECGSLFSGCEALTELKLDNFDTTYMRGAMNMFYGCSSLKNLDVSKFKTENVLSFGKMFGDCTSLDSMDLTKFELDENANIYRIFDNCTALDTIQLPEVIGSATPARARSAARDAEEEKKITCELPYVYQVVETGDYIIDLVLDESMAGKTLKLHNADAHNFRPEDIHDQVDAKCEKTGVLAYKTCSICDCDFDYTNGKTLYRARDLVIPALGHDFQYDYTSAELKDYPTCAKPGVSGTYKCAREGCDAILGEAQSLPAIGHSYELDKSEDHTNGYTIEYIKEPETIKTEMFDEDGNVYFVQEETVVKIIAKVTYYLICEGIGDWEKAHEAELEKDAEKLEEARCHHLKQVVFEFECDTHTEATCTEAETFFFDFSISYNDVIQALKDPDMPNKHDDGITDFIPISINNVFEGEEIEGGHEALGHTYETVKAVPETCEGYGSTAGQKCTVCGLVEGVQEIAPRGHKYVEKPAKDATCTEAGHSAGKVCEYCGAIGEGVKEIPPTGHHFTEEIPEELPTCTGVGHTAGKKCADCDAIEGCDLEEDLGHLEEIIPGKAPTETESGLTDGVRCSRCGEIIKPQEEIQPLGSTAPVEDDAKPALGTVAWVMIGLGSAVFTAAVVVTIVFVIRKKRRT